MNKILFVDSTHKILEEKLSSAGFVCEFASKIDYDFISTIIENYIGIIIRSGVLLDKEILTKAKKLKFIGRVGAGLESIDLEYAKLKNISCFNSPERNRDAVGEHALGMILTLFNKIKVSNNEIIKGIWQREPNRGIEIKNKTVGILGYGNMGSAFAQKLKGFNCNVIAYDKYKKAFSDNFVKEVELNELFSQTDILSIHVPLTHETKYMINEKFLNCFTKNIFVVNTARGFVLKTDDLIAEIKKGKVLGACLDVLEYEEYSFDKMNLNILPIDFKILCELENVILTPHIAGYTKESKVLLAEVLAQKIITFSRENNII